MSSMQADPKMPPAPAKTVAEADTLISEVMGVMSELADVVHGARDPSVVLRLFEEQERC